MDFKEELTKLNEELKEASVEDKRIAYINLVNKFRKASEGKYSFISYGTGIEENSTEFLTKKIEEDLTLIEDLTSTSKVILYFDIFENGTLLEPVEVANVEEAKPVLTEYYNMFKGAKEDV